MYDPPPESGGRGHVAARHSETNKSRKTALSLFPKTRKPSDPSAQPERAATDPRTMIRSSESTTTMATKPGFPATGIPPAPAATPTPPIAGMRPAAAPQGTRPASSDRRALVVGRGIALAGGAISDCERLEVHGTVEVSLNHALELSIAESGVFRGEAEIEEADISGAFDGAITAKARLVVRSTGKLSGTIRCARLMVEEGAQVSGRIEMIAPSATPAQAPAAPAAQGSAPDPYAAPAEPAFART